MKRKHTIGALAVAGLIAATAVGVSPDIANAQDKTGDVSAIYNLNQAPVYEGEEAFNVIKGKITWADFSKYGENLKEVKNQKGKDKKVLQIGSTLTLEPIPGYKLKAEVIDLKPFLASDYYKSRIDADPNATEADKLSYDPNQENFCHEMKGGNETGVELPAFMALDKQGRYSHLGQNGIKGPGDCTLGSLNDGDNVGVTFKFTATYQGHDVEPKVIVADGEECTDNGREWTGFLTKGTPWEFVANIGDSKSKVPYIIPASRYTHAGPIDIRPFAKYYVSPNANGGLGTEFFGGFSNMKSNNYASPLVVTRYADQVSLYVNSRGMQSSMFGFIFDEEGDAPESYGTAAHFIKNGNPYLGTVEPDYDFGLPGDDWVRDDINGGDEGEEQLVGAGNTYKLKVAEDKTYSMDIIANKGTNPNPYKDGPWVKAWVDFNSNGKFDEFEASEPIEVTGKDQTISLKFSNPKIKQITDVNIDKLGVRVRIAFNKNDIMHPTGYASTGEVEDFQIRVAHAPRGEYKTTTGAQGVAQTVKFGNGSGFNAYGNEDHDQAKANRILADKNNPIRIVTPEGKLVNEYKVDGQGTYTVTDAGDVTFVPEKNFTGKTTGICLRAVDDNKRSTGWTADESSLNNNQGKNGGYLINGKKTMDAVYQPVVKPVIPVGKPATSEGLQGHVQTGQPTFEPGNKNISIEISKNNPAYFVDGKGNKIKETTVDAMNDGKKVGTYTIDVNSGLVTFVPNSDFVGTPDPVSVGAKDANGTQATATYTPLVKPVKPTATADTSTGPQGASQTGVVKFASGNSAVTMQVTEKNPAYFVDKDGNKIDKNTVDAMKDGKKVGTYTIDPATAEVTFKPIGSFVGTADPCYVGAKDANGTQAYSSYTPTVTSVSPTADPAESNGLQGQTQTGTPTFKAGDDVAPIKISKDNPAYFVDGKGNKIEDTTVDAMKDGKKVGTYTINPESGEVTFVPNPDFVGTPDFVGIGAKDANGTQATTTYTPHVTPVTPTATPAESEGLQGQPQTGTPTFKAGDKVVPLEISKKNPAYFVDSKGNKIKEATVDAMKDGKKVGTYTIDVNTGIVTFVPNPDFVGTPDSVGVGAKDANGTQATTTYTPHVTPVTPTATPAESEGLQGQPQTGTPTFKPGDKEVPIVISKDNPAYFVDGDGNKIDETTVDATKNGEKVGTYTINPETGEVTFIPDGGFVGTPDSAIIGGKDANGTEVTTTYAPHVTPVVPVGKDVTSTGKEGEPQTGTPEFEGGDPLVPVEINKDNPAYFVDGDGNKIDETTIDATKNGKKVGTYTIDTETGEVTFIPDTGFVGTPDPAIVGTKDANGVEVTATYTPTVVKKVGIFKRVATGDTTSVVIPAVGAFVAGIVLYIGVKKRKDSDK